MGSRTPDLLIANETLYQLSYDPIPSPFEVIIMTYFGVPASRFARHFDLRICVSSPIVCAVHHVIDGSSWML